AGYKLGERQTGAYGASSVDPGSQPPRHVGRYEIERYRIGKKWLERDVNVSEECEDLVGRSSTLIDDSVRDSLERLHPSEIGERRAQRRRFSLAPSIDGEADAGCRDDCGRLSTPTHLLLVPQGSNDAIYNETRGRRTSFAHARTTEVAIAAAAVV